MGTFSLWHWVVLLLILSVLFGAGRQSTSAGLRFGAITFTTGVVTSGLAVLIAMAITYGDVERALDRIGNLFGFYVMTFVSSGLAWLGLGFGLRALGPPRGRLDWVMRIAATGLVLPLLSQALSIGIRLVMEGSTAPTWLGYYATPMVWFRLLLPPNVLVFLRAALLVWLAARLSVRAPAWSPGPAASHGPDQVTRILCGHAILGEPAFRRGVLKFFEDRWTAAAPEFGLDVELLANVCRGAEKQEERYTWIYAGLAVIGLPVAMIPVVGPVAFLLITAAARYRHRRGQHDLARSFSVPAFDQEAASKRFAGVLEWETAAALPHAEQNVVIYRGFMPFAGAGLDLGGWSFVTSTDRPQATAGERDIRPFTALDLYRAVEAGIKDAQIPGLRCRDLFFVRGLDVRNMPMLLPDLAERPRQRIGDDLVGLYLEEHNTLVRDYKCIQVFDWGGELVVSYFLRCSLQSTSLMVELKRFLLPPLQDNLRHVDRLRPDRFWSRVEQIGAALVVGPLLSVFSLFIAFGKVQEAVGKSIKGFLWSEERKARKRRQRVENDPSYDFGAIMSLRAQYAQNSFLHYFQKVDADFHNKVIEQKILDIIERFLDAHGIDTSGIRERQTTILNSGILLQGGDLRAESLAVGEGARATKVESKTAVWPKETVS